jgi:hypothetical protein
MHSLNGATVRPIDRQWWIGILAVALACSHGQPILPPLPAPLSAEPDSAFRIPCELAVRRAAAAGRHIYRESEVSDHVELVLVNHRGPAYPNEKTEAIPATIPIEVVVDSTGIADLSTFRPVEASPPEFLVSVRAFLSTAAFEPARVAGHPVAQCTKQTFQFVPTYYHRAGEH